MSLDQVASLKQSQVTKLTKLIAVATPIPGKDGLVSKKTPVFHLPVYKIDLQLDDDETVTFHCDLADMTHLIDQLKSYKNHRRRFGSLG